MLGGADGYFSKARNHMFMKNIAGLVHGDNRNSIYTFGSYTS